MTPSGIDGHQPTCVCADCCTARHRDLNQIIPQFLALNPPSLLKAANQQFASGLSRETTVLPEVASDLRAMSVEDFDADYQTTMSGLNASNQQLKAWRFATEAYALKLGVQLPHWVSTVGK